MRTAPAAAPFPARRSSPPMRTSPTASPSLAHAHYRAMLPPPSGLCRRLREWPPPPPAPPTPDPVPLPPSPPFTFAPRRLRLGPHHPLLEVRGSLPTPGQPPRAWSVWKARAVLPQNPPRASPPRPVSVERKGLLCGGRPVSPPPLSPPLLGWGRSQAPLPPGCPHQPRRGGGETQVSEAGTACGPNMAMAAGVLLVHISHSVSRQRAAPLVRTCARLHCMGMRLGWVLCLLSGDFRGRGGEIS